MSKGAEYKYEPFGIYMTHSLTFALIPNENGTEVTRIWLHRQVGVSETVEIGHWAGKELPTEYTYVGNLQDILPLYDQKLRSKLK